MQDTEEYTYLTLPPDEALRSCIGLVVAGMAARARIGVGGLDEAVALLEKQFSNKEPTRYRFSLKSYGLIAEVEEPQPAGVRNEPGGEGTTWRTVVELVS